MFPLSFAVWTLSFASSAPGRIGFVSRRCSIGLILLCSFTRSKFSLWCGRRWRFAREPVVSFRSFHISFGLSFRGGCGGAEQAGKDSHRLCCAGGGSFGSLRRQGSRVLCGRRDRR